MFGFLLWEANTFTATVVGLSKDRAKATLRIRTVYVKRNWLGFAGSISPDICTGYHTLADEYVQGARREGDEIRDIPYSCVGGTCGR